MNRRLGVLRELGSKGFAALRPLPASTALLETRGFPLDCRSRTAAITEEGAVQVLMPGGAYRHPVATAFNVIGCCQQERLGDTPLRRAGGGAAAAVAGVKALLDMQEADGSYRYPVPVPRYGLKPGWSSGMAQGLIVGALVEAEDVLPEVLLASTRKARSRAADHLLKGVDEGGCTSYAWGGPFFEECASVKPSGILNGACFALLGLQMSDRDRDVDASARALTQLQFMAEWWNLGFWSRYDLIDNSPSSPPYHALHVDLLLALGRRDDSRTFIDLAEAFRRQGVAPRNHYRALASLSVRRLAGVVRGTR